MEVCGGRGCFKVTPRKIITLSVILLEKKQRQGNMQVITLLIKLSCKNKNDFTALKSMNPGNLNFYNLHSTYT